MPLDSHNGTGTDLPELAGYCQECSGQADEELREVIVLQNLVNLTHTASAEITVASQTSMLRTLDEDTTERRELEQAFATLPAQQLMEKGLVDLNDFDLIQSADESGTQTVIRHNRNFVAGKYFEAKDHEVTTLGEELHSVLEFDRRKY